MKKIVVYGVFLSLLLSMYFTDIMCVDIIGLDGSLGVYNAKENTAYLIKNSDKIVYTNVVEYSQIVTPPNIKNPKLQAFATMPNPKYKESQNPKYEKSHGVLAGGEARDIILFGIKKELNQKTINIQQDSYEIYGSMGSYNPSTKTAYLLDARGNKKEYTNVVEYSQPVTPPNITNPKLKPFATMPNPKYAESQKRLAGGQAKYITLFGIEKELQQDNFDDEEDIEIEPI